MAVVVLCKGQGQAMVVLWLCYGGAMAPLWYAMQDVSGCGHMDGSATDRVMY